MPLILSALIERSWECLNHIPFVQLNKHWKFLQSRALIEKENQEKEVLEQKILPKLIDFDLDHDKCWSFEDFEEKLTAMKSQLEISWSQYNLIIQLWKSKHGNDSYSGNAKLELENIIKESQNVQIISESKNTSKIQAFMIYEAFGESAPQFILQIAILIYENPEISNLKWFTIVTSLLSVLVAVSNEYLSMPIVNLEDGKAKICFSTWKNKIVTFIPILVIITPKFFVLIVFFGICRGWFCFGVTITAFGIYFAVLFIMSWIDYRKLPPNTGRYFSKLLVLNVNQFFLYIFR